MAKIKAYLESNKKKLKIGGLSVVVIVTLGFAGNGFNAWRAEKHMHKACELLYPIGALLKDDMSYGDGVSYLSPGGRAILEQASIEAEKAGKASHYYEAFQHQVFSLEKNLKGEASNNTNSVHSPYSLYQYAILPTCNRGLNFITFQSP